jgi:HD-GYP domain-containing protein (c-di-GMP phosphodiesterase class II)
MTDTRELLQKISALRKRLDLGSVPAAPALAAESLQVRVERGSLHNQLIDNAMRTVAESDPTAPAAPPVRLTARGARLLRKGRDVLQALRTIADDREFGQLEENDPLTHLHREAVAMIEVLMRTVQSFPSAISAQLRMCDGLEVVLGDAEQRITLLCGSMAQRKRELGRINELAGIMTALATHQEVRLPALQALADAVVAEVSAGEPLRFAHASPGEPARFAAAHGLNVARVMSRLMWQDPEWQPQLQLAMVAALLHDVGMVRVPAEVLLTAGPLDNDQRRLVEKHTTAAEAMLAPLWPGRSWPLEAAVHHHERADGTGYPSGQKMLEQSPFVLLLAACDTYAAMCAPRPHRAAHDTRTALTEILFLSERDFLDKKATERLLALSFYPPGSIVELNDGAVAIVTAVHTEERGLTNPARPIVHVVLDGRGQSMPWPTTVDLLEDTSRSIVRSLPPEERRTALGKRYPELV